MKTILVPTDFSKESTYALELAISIASILKASIELVHILPSLYEPEYASTANLPIKERIGLDHDIYQAEQALRELIKKYALTDVEIKPSVKLGSIFHELPDNISAIPADLMVVGTKGDSGIHEFFVGSNAEKVVRRAHCPVITVGKKIKNFALNQVVFATDFTSNASPLVALLKEWQAVHPFTLHLIYVNTPLNFTTSAHIKSRMYKFQKQHADISFTTAIVNAYSLEEGMEEYAKEVKADLLAMVTHGREGIEHVLVGSIAEKLVNRATIPVLAFSLHAS